MENFEKGSLTISLIKSGNTMIMDWNGQSDDRDPSALLDPYFDRIIDDLKGIDLTIKFEKLEYMNSSTVQPIVLLLKKLNTHEIKTFITYDTTSKWQTASFKALKAFSSMLPSISIQD